MKKINVAELLKDCPKGMELDCTMFDNVELEFVANVKEDTYPIKLKTKHGTLISTTEYGCYDMCTDAKCVIFPKGKTSWEGFVPPCQFNDGDIIFTRGCKYTWVSIFKQFSGSSCYTYVDLCMTNNDLFTGTSSCLCTIEEIDTQRLATEEEKAKLFKAIKDNGYKWNAETKTLDKLPKFKVGDRIRHKCPEFRGERIVNIRCDTGYFTTINDWIDIAHQDDWELVSEELVKPWFKIGDRIRHKNDKTIIKTIGYVYHNSYALYDGHLLLFTDQDMWELAPNKFDINTLKPFDKVLVRNHEKNEWQPNFFNKYCKEIKKFKLIGICTPACGNTEHFVDYCIPYEGNEHLSGKTDDCAEYFKTWK